MANNTVPDISGQRFGKLVVMRFSHSQRSAMWECMCDCGNSTIVKCGNLRSGNTTSCGCVQRAAIGAVRRTHGKSRTREFRIYMAMKHRCENPNSPAYANYGGRGIRVAPEWRHDFAAFLAHLGPRPSKKHSLDRIDVNGNYEPGNVRWATRTEQARNTRANRFLTYNGRTMTLVEWGETTGLGRQVIEARLRYGWSLERALTVPKRKINRKKRCHEAGVPHRDLQAPATPSPCHRVLPASGLPGRAAGADCPRRRRAIRQRSW